MYVAFDDTDSTRSMCTTFLATEVVTWAAQRSFWRERFFTAPAFYRRAAYCALAGVALFLSKGTVTFIYSRF